MWLKINVKIKHHSGDTCMTPGQLTKRTIFGLPGIVLLLSLAISGLNAEELSVSLVRDPSAGKPVFYGLRQLGNALKEKGLFIQESANSESMETDIIIVAGIPSGEGPSSRWLKLLGISVPDSPEAFSIQKTILGGKKALLLAGSDERGLLYALLDAAERIGWTKPGGDPFVHIRNISEKPYAPERALSVYTMQRKHFESRFYNEDYWEKYFDTLARNRFNTFVLILGYEAAGFMAPAYPYFFNVDEYPDVRLVGITPEEQGKNLRALNRLIEMAHGHGLNFTLGIWDHIFRGGVQQGKTPDKPTEGLVWGVNSENLMSYTKAALRNLLQLVPAIDAIQFRMHDESGLRRDEMEAFWVDVYKIMKQYGGNIRFDARAKGFPDELIDRALEIGIPIRICTKFWMEQMGLPFHPTHIHPENQQERRHGYADLLRYPQRYKMHWRLWNGGTSRVLLWGDPEYARRFAESSHLYDGDGYEVNEPLATKMASHHGFEPFELLNAQYRYYDYEFERYWHFFQVFGRMGYNPDMTGDVWRMEFTRRFGEGAAPHVEKGLHLASKVLPMVVAYNYPYHLFPMTRGWIEKQRMDDLPRYAEALPSDTEQFLSMSDAADYVLKGNFSARRTPEESARWFEMISEGILNEIAAAEKEEDKKGTEFIVTMTDLRILAFLARYHSRRALAGTSWMLYKKSEDLNALDDAIRYEENAVYAWEALVEAAGDVYSDAMMMGLASAGLAGDWRDELDALRRGLNDLYKERASYSPGGTGKSPVIRHVPVRKAMPGQDLKIRLTAWNAFAITGARVWFGAVIHDYESINLEKNGLAIYEGVIPGEKVIPGLRYYIELNNALGSVCYPVNGSEQPVRVIVSGDTEAPHVEHIAMDTVRPGETLAINARVMDQSGIEWVRLRYRSASQFFDYRSIEMKPAGDNGIYSATVSGEDIPYEWDFMYFLEVMDKAGNGAIYPNLERETPYIIVKPDRQ